MKTLRCSWEQQKKLVSELEVNTISRSFHARLSVSAFRKQLVFGLPLSWYFHSKNEPAGYNLGVAAVVAERRWIYSQVTFGNL